MIRGARLLLAIGLTVLVALVLTFLKLLISHPKSRYESANIADEDAPPVQRIASRSADLIASMRAVARLGPDAAAPGVVPSFIGAAHERAVAGDKDIARARRRIRDYLAMSFNDCLTAIGVTRPQVEAIVEVSWKPGQAVLTLVSYGVLIGGPSEIDGSCVEAQLPQSRTVAIPDSPDWLEGLGTTREAFRLFLIRR